MTTGRIRKVVVEPNADGFALTRRILSQLPGVPVQRPRKGAGQPDRETPRPGRGPHSMGKDVLRLVRHPGALVKPCPGTSGGYICCGYQILNLAANCPLDCSYCILQAYVNQPDLRVFVNMEEALAQALRLIEGHPERNFRVGTGEFTDSLALDGMTDWSRRLIPEFSARGNALLEFKTKTDRIQGVLAAPARDRIVVSWSLNSPRIAAREEHGAASLKKRLQSAAECQKQGFAVGFHFDPLIPHPGWREGYQRVLDMMAERVDPARVIWISLGTLRYMPALKAAIRWRHPRTHVLDGEFVPGLDGKMRYFKPIRVELYRFMRKALQAWDPRLAVYLCMESDDVWERSMGWSPGTSGGLARFLDHRMNEVFGGNEQAFMI